MLRTAKNKKIELLFIICLPKSGDWMIEPLTPVIIKKRVNEPDRDMTMSHYGFSLYMNEC